MVLRSLILAVLFSLLGVGLLQATGGLTMAVPESVGMDSGLLDRIDLVAAEGIENGEMPGCVVCIGRRGRIVFLRAYGDRQVEPQKIAMSTDTVFDLASLTKPIATATSVMLLVERGQLRLRDRVSKYLPEFAQQGKQEITVQQLLTHQGGLIPDNSLKDYQGGPKVAWERIFALPLHVKPGTKFVYSDVGFMVLAELVHRVSGQTIDEFSQDNIFQPLGMRDTGYRPAEALQQRAAPTERRDGHWMRGEVHDPRAHLLGGVAGHAGLFSTAEDMARYAQMLLNGGTLQGVRVLHPGTIQAMTADQPISSGVRGLGWDKRSPYSSNRGEFLTDRAFGHGGFTGTSMWIDPGLDLFVIFLSNRLHPDGKGDVNPLAGRIGTIAAASIVNPAPAVGEVLTGIDVLREHGFQQLRGRRIGLITNHTGIDRWGQSTIRLLHEADGVQLVALFSPEHGIAGRLDQRSIGDDTELLTGLPIFSLYGETRRPTAQSLRGLDTLVFDIQDVGTRFYTYISTMGYAMQAAAEQGLSFVVLDRPNPINGVDVAGPLLDPGRESFVAFHSLPIRHGMTVGELARMFQSELKLEPDLQVIEVQGWRRHDFFDATGLPWVNPSPNMRSLTEAVLYPGIGLLETTNLSVGRGTDTPFEVIGAPWLDGRKLAAALRKECLPGICFVPIRFTPDAGKYRNEECGGINVIVTNRDEYRPIGTGLAIARQLRRLYPDEWNVKAYNTLLGNAAVHQQIKEGKSVEEIQAGMQEDLRRFLQRRRAFLLYP